MPFKVGFIVGKDTDVVEDPKYAAIPGDASFLSDLDNKYRVDPESKEFLMDCEPGTKGFAHSDVALAWYIKRHYEDIAIDIITCEEVTLPRLKSNDINFSVGYNAVNICVSNDPNGQKKMNAFKKCGNIFPTWEVENFILHKSKYMKACMKAGVPMAPTIFAPKDNRSPARLLKEIKSRGWQQFVMKLQAPHCSCPRIEKDGGLDRMY